MSRTPPTLELLVEPLVRSLTPEVAKAIAELRADPDLQDRMDELAEKCNEGKLTPYERDEYDTNIRFSSFLAIIQAKARRMLKNRDRRK